MMWNNTTVAPYNPIKHDYPHEILILQGNTKEKDIVFGCVNYVAATRPDAGSYSHFALQHPHRGFYVLWAKQFILFHRKRHPLEMGEAEVGEFLTYLSVERNVAASTQNQALSAILFL